MGTSKNPYGTTLDGSPRSDEAHQEGVRGRLLVLYIHEELKICCDDPIVTSDKLIEKYRKNKKYCIPRLLNCNWFGNKSSESAKVKLKKILSVGAVGDK